MDFQQLSLKTMAKIIVFAIVVIVLSWATTAWPNHDTIEVLRGKVTRESDAICYFNAKDEFDYGGIVKRTCRVVIDQHDPNLVYFVIEDGSIAIEIIEQNIQSGNIRSVWKITRKEKGARI